MTTEEGVKKLLSSLIVSCPQGMTIEQLGRDYRSVIGNPIPFMKYGFVSLESFLYSIPDVCRVHGTGPHALVEPIINEKLKHINDMVMKQKTSKPKKKRPNYNKRMKGILIQNNKVSANRPAPARTVPGSCETDIRRERNLTDSVIAPTVNNDKFFTSRNNNAPLSSNLNNLNKSSSPSCHQSPEKLNNNNAATNARVSSYEGPNHFFNTSDSSNSNISKEFCNTSSSYNITKIGEICNSNNFCSNDSYYQPVSSPEDNLFFNDNTDVKIKHNLSLQSSSLVDCKTNIEENIENLLNKTNFSSNVDDYCSELEFSDSFEDLIYVSDDETQISEEIRNVSVEQTNDSGFIQPTNSVPSRSLKITGHIRNNLKLLIGENPDGIWCSKLSHLYKLRFNEELESFDYGYSTISEMCEELSDIFHIVRPGKTDWKVFDIRMPCPQAQDIEEWVDHIKKYFPPTVSPPSEAPFPKEMLKTKQLSSIKYPRDAVKLGEDIEMQWIPEDKKINDYIEIIVSEVYDPSKFWIQLKCYSNDLDKLMDNLQIFYGQNADEYKIIKKYVRVGLYCTAIFLNEYHRAVVLQIYADETVKVFYIDYGTVAEIHISRICFLHQKFTCLPQQAIRARLSGIIPKDQNTMWPRKASRRFFVLIKDKDLVALIKNIDTKDYVLSLIVTDVSKDDTDIHVNDVLLDEGFSIIGNQAEICASSNAIVPNVHLYPTFDEIENGCCPTVSDLDKFEKLGIKYEQIFVDYFKPYKCYSLNSDVENSITKSVIESDKETSSEATESVEDNLDHIKLSNVNSVKPPPGFNNTSSIENTLLSNTCQNENSSNCSQNYQKQVICSKPLKTCTSSDIHRRETISAITSNLNHILLYLHSINIQGSTNQVQLVVNIVNECNTILKLLQIAHLQDSERNLLHHQFLIKVNLMKYLLLKNEKSSATYFNSEHLLNKSPDEQIYANVEKYNDISKVIVPNIPITQTIDQNIKTVSVDKHSKKVNANKNTSVKSISDNKKNIEEYAENSDLYPEISKFVESSCVLHLRMEDFSIHLIKLDKKFYISTQEIVTKLLRSDQQFYNWLKQNGLQISTFPGKVVNLLHFSDIYKEVIKYNIPGIVPPNNLGCNVRLTPLEEVPKIIATYGTKLILENVIKLITELKIKTKFG